MSRMCASSMYSKKWNVWWFVKLKGISRILYIFLFIYLVKYNILQAPQGARQVRYVKIIGSSVIFILFIDDLK